MIEKYLSIYSPTENKVIPFTLFDHQKDILWKIVGYNNTKIKQYR